MNEVTYGAAMVMTAIRMIVLAVVAILAVLFLLDWAVRTRKVGPFSALARFCRANVDPLVAPMERRIVRAGGVPSSAPLWALAVAVIGGIILISVANYIITQIMMANFALSSGPSGLYHLLVVWTFGLLKVALLVRVLSSWFPVSPYSPWVRWAFSLSEPILRPLRQIVPNLGMIDITPIIAFFALGLLQSLFLSIG
jgi:YggT family protein